MQLEVEEVLKTVEPAKQVGKGDDQEVEGKTLDAKLIKLPIIVYDGDPLTWLGFWEQFCIAKKIGGKSKRS